MRSNKGFEYLAIMLLSFLFVSCGKINSEPKTTEPQPTQQNQTDKPTLPSTTTKDNKLYIYSSLASGKDPIIGDNEYNLRAVLSSDLKSLSADAKVIFSYSMPAMPEMGKVDEAAVKQTDGTYTAKLFYSMPGSWEVIIKIEDKELKDEYTFNVKL